MKQLLMILSLAFQFNCKNSKVSYTTPHSLKGKWFIMEGQTDSYYERLEFDSSNVTIYTFGDTVLSYRYEIKNENLILTDINNTSFTNKISKLKDDTLVFQTLLDNKTMQSFIKR